MVLVARRTTAPATPAGRSRACPTDRPVDGITDLLIDGDIYVAENGAVGARDPGIGLVAAAADGHRAPARPATTR